MRRRAAPYLLSACLAPACAGSAPSSTPPPTEPDSVQDGPGEIPWAEGQRPDDPSSVTRDVGEQPSSVDDAIVVQDPGEGIVAAGSGRCNGKVSLGLKADVQVRAQEIQSCASEFPADQDSMKGGLKFSLRVDETGQVAAVEVLADTLQQPAVLSCAEALLQKPFAEGPKGGCAVFVLPLSIEAQRAEP